MAIRIPIAGDLVLELDLDLDDVLETAWWSWGGLTFAEAHLGRA